MQAVEMADTEVRLGGQAVRLCPERAVWWPGPPEGPSESPPAFPPEAGPAGGDGGAARGGTLFIADPHLGKADLFRRRGIPVPHAAAEADLERLSSLLTRTGAARLIVLGDLLHSRPEESDATVASVAAWREKHAHVAMHLVRGNHDRHAGPPLEGWSMTWCDEPCVWEGVPFVLRHHPADDERGYVLCGHVHPAVAPVQSVREAMKRLPCFVAKPGRLVLPAFGTFTGTHRVGREEGDRVYAVAESRVIALPPQMVR